MDLTDAQLNELAKLVKQMADTGAGTDFCLDHGCLPLPVHYYSPVPDLKELDRRKVWEKISPLRGVNMQPEVQLSLLTEMANNFARECNWPKDATANLHQYHYENTCFGFQCASLLHYMIRFFRPKRVIEVGSGYSSRVINTALQYNKLQNSPCQYEIIDPYPEECTQKLPLLTTMHKSNVEEIPEECFSALESGDILFIDSGHVVKIGGDVNFLILDVLPLLKPGVVIHFHDIPMPTEYGRFYFSNPSFRMLWTESYLLQAFLAFNTEFEVLASACYLHTHYAQRMHAVFPNDPKTATSGSIWIRRVVK